MDDFLRDFIVKKWKIGRFTFTFLDALLAVCITGTGIFLRLPVINHTVTGPEKIGAVVLDYVLALLCAAIVYRCHCISVDGEAGPDVFDLCSSCDLSDDGCKCCVVECQRSLLCDSVFCWILSVYSRI